MVDTLVEAVESAAQRWPDRIAWTFDPGPRMTFAEVDAASKRYAGALRQRGVRSGDRVAVMLPNGPGFPLTWLALARLGAVMVPLNIRYGSADAEHIRASAATTLTITEDDLPMLAEGPELVADHQPRAGDTTNIQFTSGSTGLPKGCVLSHEYWTRLGTSMIAEFPFLSENDVLLTAQAFHYIDPQWNVVAGLLSGAELVVLDGFHPSSFWDKVREHDVTYFYCLGAMPNLLLRMPISPKDREHRVRAIQCSAIPAAAHRELEERWGVPWYEAFGMTETGADLRVTADEHDELVGTGCLGRPTAHREAQIVDEDGNEAQRGELQLRGPGMMDGYLGGARVEGWFRTGDLCWADDKGRIYHAGRLKDTVRRSGENVAAREVEEALMSHPAVRLAAVTGVPDDLRGEEVKVYCVADRAVPEELAEHCARLLAPFKVPRYWEFHDQLPTTASLRVEKSKLDSLGGRVFDRATGGWA
ncbi:AMP-binding protein [Allokutzneria sp. NRRL B-24872]|uniref:AMP-binding protein n=1 Tax=Allokutzneria sp. NRRL B-24872 TaxID=1137961 RepID=UPI000A3B9305|nr:AMP-binding protein [Allokutzneria sp. NRRL B-24872]